MHCALVHGAFEHVESLYAELVFTIFLVMLIFRGTNSSVVVSLFTFPLPPSLPALYHFGCPCEVASREMMRTHVSSQEEYAHSANRDLSSAQG